MWRGGGGGGGGGWGAGAGLAPRLKIGTVSEEAVGAGNGTRTRDIKLGKLALYQLSYARPMIERGKSSRAGRRGQVGAPHHQTNRLYSVHVRIRIGTGP